MLSKNTALTYELQTFITWDMYASQSIFVSEQELHSRKKDQATTI